MNLKTIFKKKQELYERITRPRVIGKLFSREESISNVKEDHHEMPALKLVAQRAIYYTSTRFGKQESPRFKAR